MARTEPWIAQGISRTTYYRRLKPPSEPGGVPTPWEKAGISQATWYRRKRQGWNDGAVHAAPAMEPARLEWEKTD